MSNTEFAPRLNHVAISSQAQTGGPEGVTRGTGDAGPEVEAA